MNKTEFLKMMIQDNETRDSFKRAIYADVIDCMEIALSQTPESVELAPSKNAEAAFKLIEREGRINPEHCVGPFRAAEIIAEYLGVSYVRASKKFGTAPAVKSLEDFL